MDIDLHVHSNASDGTCFPGELVEKAAALGLKAFALTDHDNINGIAEALKTAERLRAEGKDVEVVPGVEISCAYKNQDIHIVGLYIDETDRDFQKSMQKAVNERANRNVKMIKNLNDAGLAITMEDLTGDNPDTLITRAHFGRALLAKGYVSSISEAFEKYLGPETPYFVPRSYITPELGVEMILATGGVPVLAHPFLYKLTAEELDALVAALKETGLVGIEVYYSEFDDAQTAAAMKLAQKYQLCPSGGSDFHGVNKPHIQLGSGMGNNLDIPYSLLEELRKHAKPANVRFSYRTGK